MISNLELHSLLMQDGIRLSEFELAEVKSLLIQLATIEHQTQIERRVELNAADTNNFLHFSRDTDYPLQLAA